MIWIGASWLFQDILQAFLTQNILAPEYFLLFLLYRTLSQEGSGKSSIWIAFIGGILWDLRWTGLVGMSSGLYIVAVLILNWIWHLFPGTGKTPLLLALLVWFGALNIYLARVFVWDIPVFPFYTGFLVQQLCLLPAVIIIYVYYSWKVASQNG